MADSNSIDQFVNITGGLAYLAEQYISRNNGDVMKAVQDFYATQGTSAIPQGPSRSSSSRGVRTLRDLGDDDGSDDEKTNNLFTGGEKLGLAVEGPNRGQDENIIELIFRRAKEQMGEADDRPSAQQPDAPIPKFTGTGFKLGDGSGASELIAGAAVRVENKVTRDITFWRQGFTVGNGPLHRYDDPANENVLQEINRGRVPVSLLDVEFGQDVDVQVYKKTDEDYVPPKRVAQGYQGHGHRLGSPVPGEGISLVSESTTPVAGALTPPPEPQGDTLVQIRFANGKKVSYKFDLSLPVQVVYDFVSTHGYNDANGRQFTLNHAFPVKAISTDGTVGEAGLKNAVIVQRWV